MARLQVRHRSPMMATRLARPVTGHPASDMILTSLSTRGAPFDITEEAFNFSADDGDSPKRDIRTAPPGQRSSAVRRPERPLTSHAGIERSVVSGKTRPTAAAAMVQNTEQGVLARKLMRMG